MATVHRGTEDTGFSPVKRSSAALNTSTYPWQTCSSKHRTPRHIGEAFSHAAINISIDRHMN